MQIQKKIYEMHCLKLMTLLFYIKQKEQKWNRKTEIDYIYIKAKDFSLSALGIECFCPIYFLFLYYVHFRIYWNFAS